MLFGAWTPDYRLTWAVLMKPENLKTMRIQVVKHQAWVSNRDDDLHDLMIALLESKRVFDPFRGASFRTWFINTVKYTLLDLHRAGRPRHSEELKQRHHDLKVPVLPDWNEPHAPEEPTDTQPVHDWLHTLPDHWSSYLVLRAKGLRAKASCYAAGINTYEYGYEIPKLIGAGDYGLFGRGRKRKCRQLVGKPVPHEGRDQSKSHSP